jgi:hypothetical protein
LLAAVHVNVTLDPVGEAEIPVGAEHWADRSVEYRFNPKRANAVNTKLKNLFLLLWLWSF